MAMYGRISEAAEKGPNILYYFLGRQPQGN